MASILVDPRESVPTSTSGDTAWMNFADDCVSALGSKAGCQIFIKAWSNRGSASANTSALREYLKKYGIVISATSIFGSIDDTVKDAVSSVTDGIGSIFNMGKYATYGVISVGLVSVILIVVGVTKNPKAYEQLAAKAAI